MFKWCQDSHFMHNMLSILDRKTNLAMPYCTCRHGPAKIDEPMPFQVKRSDLACPEISNWLN